MTQTPPVKLRMADLATRKPTRFALAPDADARRAIAATLDILEVRKLRLDGEITPQGGRDWHLAATLGATVSQPCAITLDPVVTRIDEPVTRTFIAEFTESEASEVEMTLDETVEPIPAVLDLEALMIEALSLALPPFPRAPGAELGQAVYAEGDATPMTDDDAKPFAGLGALRDQLAKKD